MNFTRTASSVASLSGVEDQASSSLEQGSSSTTIVLADDHTVVRNALRLLLDAEPGFEVVAEAGDADTAVRYVRGHKPTVLILDLNMPGRSSLDAVPDVRKASPGTEIVVLTMQNEPAYARRALAAGVRGYVLKEAADGELVQAVRSAAAGKTYLQPALGAKLAAGADGRNATPTPRSPSSSTSASARWRATAPTSSRSCASRAAPSWSATPSPTAWSKLSRDPARHLTSGITQRYLRVLVEAVEAISPDDETVLTLYRSGAV
jgi:DNA-binding NarL/FixJ family response regulator